MTRIRKSRRDREVPNIVGKNIARLRAYRGLTQEDLAKKIEICKQQIGRIERGESKLSFKDGLAIAKVFECLPEELIKVENAEKR